MSKVWPLDKNADKVDTTMKSDADLHSLLADKDEDARVQIAHRVGDVLSVEDLPDAERLAAEALARELVSDAIERVRRELSIAVRRSKFLPRDVALKIAHDVDSIACPFLETTDVFSEGDWQQLVLTISRGARIAVARRASMSEGLALLLVENGDSVVAETLVENTAAPITAVVGHALIERFQDSAWVLDKLAERSGLGIELAVQLLSKVSDAAREKLSKTYNLRDFTDPVAADAELAALLPLVRETPETRLSAVVESLRREKKLTHYFLLMALRAGLLEFFEVAVAALSNSRLEHIRTLVLRGGALPMIDLLTRCRVPQALHGDFWDALQTARRGATHAGVPD
jgi:uncharacterized protein (DUF2336 family)